MDEKDMKYKRKNRKRKESGIGKDVNFFELLFLCFFVIRNPKEWRTNNSYLLYKTIKFYFIFESGLSLEA
jgi:hypothetical protein